MINIFNAWKECKHFVELIIARHELSYDEHSFREWLPDASIVSLV